MAQAGERKAFDFDDAEVGKPPPGFSTATTNGGEAGVWVVQEEGGGRVLRQTSADETRGRFPVCVFDGLEARDVDVSVRFRPISGSVDQAAGIVWRYRDPDNYYIVRANALEGNVVLYKVEGGKRSDLKPAGSGFLTYGKKADVPSGTWSRLRLLAKGDRFSVFLDGGHLFDVEDATFGSPGRVGLWTKADSVTSFDDLVVESLDGDPT